MVHSTRVLIAVRPTDACAPMRCSSHSSAGCNSLLSAFVPT
jgi:hypothetical protein